MRKNAEKIIKRILSLLEEAESYEFHKQNLLNSVDSLFREYQEGRYAYAEYQKLLEDILKRRTKNEWVDYYDSYIFSILKQIEPLLSQMIYFTYNDDSIARLAADYGTHAEEKDHEGEKPAKTKAVPSPEIEEDKRHELRKIKGEEAEEFIEFEIEPLIRKPISPLKERFEHEIGEIRKGRKEPDIDVRMPEIRKKSVGFLQKFRIYLNHYIERRRIEGRKKHISRELDRIKKPSLFMLFARKLADIKPKIGKKPKPVAIAKPSLFSRIAESISSRFGPKEKLEFRKLPEKPRARQESRRQKPGIFRAFTDRILNYARPSPKAEMPLKLEEKRGMKGGAKAREVAPKKDEALEKLMTGLDRIDKGIVELKVSEPKKSMKMKIDLFIIRLHTRIKQRRWMLEEKAVRKVPEEAEEMPEEEEIEIAMPKVVVKAPEHEKKIKEAGFFETSYLNWKQAASGAIANIKKLLFVRTERPSPLPKPVLIPEAKPAELLKAKPEAIPEAKAAEAEKPSGIMFRLSWSAIKEAYGRMMAREKRFVSKKASFTTSLQMQALKEKVRVITEEEAITPKLLREEVESIQKIIAEKKKFKVYQPSFIGSFANATIRRFTFYLIERYPSFFKTLYDNLRLANIKLLSNTYVNIMLLTTIIVSAMSSIFFFSFFLFTNNPFLLVVMKTIIMVILTGGAVFLLFYTYPQMNAKTRERSINTNLPFAINHIAAVAGSGVPPTKMFKLIMESEEYGEIAVEIEKIVEYIELFGYDMLTAMRSVALTTPSVAFKELLEGMISTIESGGELSAYLKEKTSEAMLEYELERQKYTETMSTYSDVYTGILIAAPLFFIVALSLISMLGGTIGGLEVNVVIVVGAYVVIPLLNILFIILLELTQPEV